MAGCSCNGLIANSAYPNGVKPFGVTTAKILVPLIANDGTRNGIDLEGDLNEQIFDLIYNPDPSKRGYIFGHLRNVTSEQADATFETADNGERFKLRDGIRTIKYQAWGVNEQYYAKAKDVCTSFGVYDVDVCGNIRGVKNSTDEFLYPRNVNQYSYNVMFHDATNDASPKVTFEYDYDFVTNDANSWMLTQDELGLNPNEINGILDVNLTIAPVDDTTLTVSATFQYGTALTLLPFKGLTLSDLEAFNVTDDSSITVGAVSQTGTDGVYTVTIPAQATNDQAWLKVFRNVTETGVYGFESAKKTFVCL